MDINNGYSKRNVCCTDNKGFTLVELLVVISIIALLLSILMPALSKVRAQGRRTICASNIHTMNVAILTYFAQEGNYPAVTWDSTNRANTYYWTERLVKAGVIKGKYDRSAQCWKIDQGQYKAYTCPEYLQIAKLGVQWTALSYAFNDRYLSPSLGTTPAAMNAQFVGKLYSKPLIMIMESDYIHLGSTTNFPNSLKGNGGTNPITIPKRHGGSLHAGWLDGHVEIKKLSEYTPRMINPKFR